MIATTVVVAVVVVVAATSAASVVMAAGRAQDAADAAALAAAHAGAAAVSPTAAAGAAATTHGAQLVTCDCAGPVARVTVRVPVVARPARLVGVTSRTATARARLVPAGVGPSGHQHPLAWWR